MRNVKPLRDFEYKLREINREAGFDEVSVAQTGLSNIYEKGIKDQNMIKFMNGAEVYALRPDFTTAIVECFVKEKDQTFSSRVSYFGKIFRKQYRANESYQAGVEIFYDDCATSDVAVLRHAGRFVRALGVNNYIICVGLAPFIEHLGKKLGLKDQGFDQLVATMQDHNHVLLRSILADHLPSEEFNEIWEMFTVRDNQRILALLKKYFYEVYQQSQIAEIIGGLDDHFILDLSLVKSLDYYTGIIFDAYIADYPYSILHGGRYDQLSQKFGGSFPAIGFAMNLDYVLENCHGK